jgi:hypothetical protein
MGEQGGKGFILINDPDLIPHPHIEVTLWKGGACDTSSFFRYGSERHGMQ